MPARANDPDERIGDKTGLVLAGGGARGAYEAGALAELLPKLEKKHFPKVVVGTSVGALQAAYFGANAHLGPGRVMETAIELWGEIEPGDVIKPLRSGFVRAVRYGLSLARIREESIFQILDPAPLRRTLAEKLDFDQLNANIGAEVDTVAVVATAAATSRSVVFFDGTGRQEHDNRRGIDYYRTQLVLEHVMASAAIPIAFPAVAIPEGLGPPGQKWYFDGGTRLNTAIKPVLTLGADRVIIVALNSVPQKDERTRAAEGQPAAAEAAMHVIQAVLVDPLVQDAQTLAARNAARRGKTVPYILISPEPYAIGKVADRAYERFRRRPLSDIAMLGRLTGKSAGPAHGEVLSYLFFAHEFTKELIELGRRDARRWLDGHADESERYWRRAPLEWMLPSP
jgi:NTE family protein